MSYLCCVCDNYTKPSSKFCKNCEVIYKAVEFEDWFVELSKLMQKQRNIDNMERYSLNTNALFNMETKSKKIAGRPETPPVIKEVILNIKRDNKTMSVRKIEKLCRNSGITISRETIRRILTQN